MERVPLARIGLLSDSHGRARTTRLAVKTLLQHSIDVLVHLGDIGSIEVIDELVLPPRKTDAGEEPIDVQLVFGNVDWDQQSMERYAQQLGIAVAHPVGRLTVGHDGKDGQETSIVFLHGHDETALQSAISEGVAYVAHGHSHRTRDEMVGSTRVINPGALFRASEYTVAVLDTEADTVVFYEVKP